MSKSTKGASAPILFQSTKPRCRKGDLALIIKGPNAGLIVDVVEYYHTVAMSDGALQVDAWHIRHSSDDPGWEYFKEDKYLLPIRPGDLDETGTDDLSIVKGESA